MTEKKLSISVPGIFGNVLVDGEFWRFKTGIPGGIVCAHVSRHSALYK